MKKSLKMLKKQGLKIAKNENLQKSLACLDDNRVRVNVWGQYRERDRFWLILKKFLGKN